MKSIRLSLLAVVALAGWVAGHCIGSASAERRVAHDCVTERRSSLLSVQIECTLAPGWRERH